MEPYIKVAAKKAELSLKKSVGEEQSRLDVRAGNHREVMAESAQRMKLSPRHRHTQVQ